MGSAATWLCLLAGLLTLGAFVVRDLHVPDPLLGLRYEVRASSAGPRSLPLPTTDEGRGLGARAQRLARDQPIDLGDLCVKALDVAHRGLDRL
jgi:hypothetical protein